MPSIRDVNKATGSKTKATLFKAKDKVKAYPLNPKARPRPN